MSEPNKGEIFTALFEFLDEIDEIREERAQLMERLAALKAREDELTKDTFVSALQLLPNKKSQWIRPTPQLKRMLAERDGPGCAICGGMRMVSSDHVIPELAGGPTNLENLELLCFSCNASKHHRAHTAILRVFAHRWIGELQ